MISPTMNYEVGHIASFPIIVDKNRVDEVSELVKKCIEISKEDWNLYEISWDFAKHPLVFGNMMNATMKKHMKNLRKRQI